MGVIIGIGFILMAIIPIYKTKWYIAPYTLVSIIWGIYLLFREFYAELYFPLGQRFYLSILLWVSAFYTGSIISDHYTKTDIKQSTPNRVIMKMYFIITPIFAIISAYLSIRQALNSANFFLYLRAMSTGLDPTIEASNKGIFTYLTSLILILFLLELAQNGISRKKVVILLFSLNVLLSVVTMAKTVLFSTFVSAVIVLISNKKIRLKYVFYSAGLLIVCFIILQTLRSENDGIELNFIGHYLLPNSVAFEYANMRDNLPFGSYVFRLVYAIGHSIGLTDAPVPVIMNYVNVANGSITNTYTVLYPFYHDFGFHGIIIFGFIEGCIGGFFYKKSKKSIPAKVFYAIFASTIVFQLFGEVLFSNASMYIQYLFYAYLPFINYKHGRYLIGNLQRSKIPSHSN